MVKPLFSKRTMDGLLLLTLALLQLETRQVMAGWYLGCYKENIANRAINISAGNYIVSDTSAQECTSSCAFLKQSYAATEGNLCFCSNGNYDVYGKATNDSQCDVTCSAQSCDSTSYVRVYSTQGAIGELKLHGPKVGWMFREVSFSTVLGKGDLNNLSYTFDFGDGSYVLTTCPNATHVYTRVGEFHVKASARSNESGPILASTWVLIQNPTGKLTLDYPKEILEVGNETEIVLSVSQGTWMTALLHTTHQKDGRNRKSFNVSDPIIHDIGSSATFGNSSNSPETDGAYVIPSAMLKKDGFLLAWEFFASKLGSIQLQVYRPNCSSLDSYFCPRNYSCIPKADSCVDSSLFSCPGNKSICVGTGHCLSTCQGPNKSFLAISSPVTDYVVVAETVVNITKLGNNLFPLASQKAIEVKAGDVIGWVGNGSSGTLAFEKTINDPSFYFSSSSSSFAVGSDLTKGSATRHEIKHVLRAHVSQPSQAAVVVEYTQAGVYNVSVSVGNVAESELRSCKITVQERIESLRIVEPLTNISYPKGEQIILTSAVDKGSDINYTWTTDGATYNVKNPKVLYNNTGFYPVLLYVHNAISSANASSVVRILEPASVAWREKPPTKIDVGAQFNFSVVLNGTNVTLTVKFEDGSNYEKFYTSALNTVVNITHNYTRDREYEISIEARNNISSSAALLKFSLKVVGDISIRLDPPANADKVLHVSTGQLFEIEVSVSNEQEVNYTFTYGESASESVRTEKGYTKWSHKYDTPTDFNISIKASGYSQSKFVHVIANSCAPAINFLNKYTEKDPQIVTRGTTINFLKVNVETKKECPKGEPVYSWDITPSQAISEAEKKKESFVFEARSLDTGDYTITLNVSYNGEKYPFKTFIRVVSSPLVAYLSGGSFRQVDSNLTQLTLNASQSFDPDDKDIKLNFKWQCKVENNSSPAVPDELCNSTEFVDIIDQESNETIKLRTNKFRTNVKYTFQVNVTEKASSRSSSAQQIVMLEPNIPQLEISCRDCQEKLNPFERITLVGKCTNCKSYERLDKTTWKLLYKNRSEHELSGNNNVTDSGLGWNNINLVLKEGYLEENTEYIAQLNGSRAEKSALAEYTFQTTSRPGGGSATCEVLPQEGSAAETPFKIKCENWVTIDNPISYEFRYKTKIDNLAQINSLSPESQANQVWYFGERSTPSRVLPIGDPNNSFQLQLSARICNKYQCCAIFPLNATVKEPTGQIDKVIQQLEEVDAKKDPKKVVQVVNSLISIIDQGNKSETTNKGQQTKEKSKLVTKLSEIDITDTSLAQQTIGALIKVTKDKTEVTSNTQNQAAGIAKGAASVLKESAKNLGAVKVEEIAREIYTASSNTLEASKETTADYTAQLLKDIFPTTAPPSRDWSVRISSLRNQEEADKSKEVVDTILSAMDLVSGAILRKRVPEEGETEIKTQAFDIRLRRLRKQSFNNSAYKVETSEQLLVSLPNPDVVLKDANDKDPVDLEYTSMENIFRSDETSSPYITKIQGFALKQGKREIKIQNLTDDLKVNILTDLKSVSSRFSEQFSADTEKSHRFQSPPGQPYTPLLVYVKSDDNTTLTGLLHITFEGRTSSKYRLRFSPTFPDEDVSATFRKVDNFTYMAWGLPQRPVYFNLTVKVPGLLAEEKPRVVNYTVAIYPVRCMYWGMEEKKWLDEGCKVGEETSIAATNCLCNHATFFGSLNVKPNPIGPLSYAKLKDGYAMLVFVSIIFALYFLALIWARRKDRADVVRVGVCPLRDNEPSDPYRYEVTLWTGMRRNAGTKSKVSIILYGDEQESEARALHDPERNPFQRGSQDSFLLTTPFDLGSIHYIRVWHDNAGGSWFLSRIMVIDLQTEERFYFICNRWLAVDEEDGQVERLVMLASKAELTEFGHLFVARTRRNLSDSHLWFSVLARPAGSRFTRVQRLSCCLCLLLMSMMTSGMYYGPRGDPSNTQQIGSIVFTWNQVLVGIISSLIVFPINLIVVQIFRNVRPKPKVKPKKPPPTPCLPTLSFDKDSLDNYNNLKESSDDSAKGSRNSLDFSREKNNKTRLSINDVHTDVDRTSFTDSPLLIDRRLSTTYDIAPTSRARRLLLWFKKKNTLPFYFVYVAWFFVFIFSAGSAAVIVFYGMEFKNEKSLQWLFSSCVSFVQDVFITQPLKVLGLAVFFALVVKKPDKGEFQVTEEVLKLAEDEEFLGQQSDLNSGGSKTKKAKLFPPDQARLIAMRAARMKERKMYSVIREVATYYIFLALLLTIAYTHRDKSAYFQTKHLFDIMGDNFSKITNEKEFWNWTQSELLTSLFPKKWYNGEERKPDGFMVDGYSQMVGGARMRLLRVKRESCRVPTELYGITKECYGEYFVTKNDKNDYTEGWENITTYDTPVSWDDMPWRYQNSSQLDGYPFLGTLTTYSGGGYVIVLEPGLENFRRVRVLEKNMWIERRTRAVLTEFTIYNAQSNLFSIVTLAAEYPATGAAIPYVSIQTARLYDFNKTIMLFVLTIEVVFVLFTLFFFYREVKHIYKLGIQAYLKEFWNCVEMGISLFTFAAIAMYVYRTLTIRNVLDLVRHDPFNFKSFQFAGYWNETYTFVLAMIVLLANIKLNKLLRFNKRFSLLSSTLKYAYYPLLMFSIVWGIVFLAYTMFASLVFGPVLYNYRSIMASLTSLLSLMLGRTAYFEMRDTNRVLGPLFFFGFMFMMSFVLINMFLSIVVDSFIVVKHDNDKQSNEYEIVDFIIERFKLWSGIGKTRRPQSRGKVLWETATSRVKAVNVLTKSHLTSDVAGLHEDSVSKLENRLEKLIDRTEELYGEIFPEKKYKNSGKTRGRVEKGEVPVSKGDILEGQTG